MKILVTGATGLLGSAIIRQLRKIKVNPIALSSKHLNLLKRDNTFEAIKYYNPEIIINAAAVVGGIKFNILNPVKLLSENIQMQTNLIDAAHRFSIKNFIYIGSSCMYPKNAVQPFKEASLMSGKLEPTNIAFATAKIAGHELINAYRKEFNHDWRTVILNNIYGPNDNFDVNASHVIAGLIYKFTNAKINGSQEVKLLGTGKSKRDFLYSDDAAMGIIHYIQSDIQEHLINIGSGEEIFINDLANRIAKQVKFNGKITWDSTYSDGLIRKTLDTSIISDSGWKPEINLEEGLARTIKWFSLNKNLGH